jgi:hypothetical protein
MSEDVMLPNDLIVTAASDLAVRHDRAAWGWSRDTARGCGRGMRLRLLRRRG